MWNLRSVRRPQCQQRPAVLELDRFARVSLQAPFPFAEAARTGEPVWLASRAQWIERYPDSVSTLRADTEATVSLPLTVAGRVLGTLSASFTAPRLFEDE